MIECPVGARPDPPLVEAEVAGAAEEPDRVVAALDAQPLELLERERPRFRRLDEAVQLGVFVAVGDRVEPQRRSLQAGAELGEAQPEPLAAAPDGDAVAQAGKTCRRVLFGIRPQLAEPDEVRVRVEHDHPQRRLQQQPLEHDAERVRLA